MASSRRSSTPMTPALGRLLEDIRRDVQLNLYPGRSDWFFALPPSLLPSADELGGLAGNPPGVIITRLGYGPRRPEQLETSLPARADAVSPRVQGDMSLEASSDTSPLPAGATSLGAVVTGVAPVPERRCGWCRSPLEATRFRWCSTKCRQTAWRARLIELVEDPTDTPKRIRISDPPYLGCARRYYQHEESYAGEVDHEALIAESERDFDGWALACSTKSLRVLLPLCPPRRPGGDLGQAPRCQPSDPGHPRRHRGGDREAGPAPKARRGRFPLHLSRARRREAARPQAPEVVPLGVPPARRVAHGRLRRPVPGDRHRHQSLRAVQGQARAAFACA